MKELDLENLTEQQINEVFGQDDATTLYPVQNLTPSAKVPQMLHIKVPGTNDLLVRLTHMDTVGTRVKAVAVGDKAVQVFLMSLSEKGNITDFRNGLGSDPVGAINTIFSTIMDIAKKYKFESILFRFPKSKMKGQEKPVQRILNMLIKNRSGGRFTTLDEITRAESKKFSFVLAYRKNSDILDEIPLDDNIQKVETKVGDAYVDTETGKQVSKSEAIADAIVKKSEKISTQSVMSKTKISRQKLISALYGEDFKSLLPPKALEVFNDLDSTANPLPAKGVDLHPAITVQESAATNELFTFGHQLDRLAKVGHVPEGYEQHDTSLIFNHLMRVFETTKVDPEKAKEFILYLFSRSGLILQKAKPMQLHTTFKQIAQAAMDHPTFSGLDKQAKLIIINPILQYVMTKVQERFTNIAQRSPGLYKEGSWDNAQLSVMKSYTDDSYAVFNEFLRGSRIPTSPEYLGERIKIFDKAFEDKGVRLKKGTQLYRAQELTKLDFTRALENKLFYFRNFVSTSLMPIIYQNSQFLTGGFDGLVGNTEDHTQTTPNEIDQLKYAKPDAPAKSERVYISYVISGADKIKVLIPGAMAEYIEEQEVILPRGTVIKYTKVLDTGAEIYANNVITQRSFLVEADVQDPSILQESVVYDGDLFMETGEFVPMEISEPTESEPKLAQGSFMSYYAQGQAGHEQEVDEMLAALSLTTKDKLSKKFV